MPLRTSMPGWLLLMAIAASAAASPWLERIVTYSERRTRAPGDDIREHVIRTVGCVLDVEHRLETSSPLVEPHRLVHEIPLTAVAAVELETSPALRVLVNLEDGAAIRPIRDPPAAAPEPETSAVGIDFQDPGIARRFVRELRSRIRSCRGSVLPAERRQEVTPAPASP